MKKSTKITIDKKEYEICFNIRSLARLEEEIGTSLLGFFRGGVIDSANISFAVAGLKHGITNITTDDEAYDLIEEYCVYEDIDSLNGAIIGAILGTGFFTPKQKNIVDETMVGQ
jgi:hypothetical protein